MDIEVDGSNVELQLFEQLKQKAEQKEVDKREKELNDRLRSQSEKQSQRLGALVWLQLRLPSCDKANSR
jgi:hypothetical protein